MYLITFSYNSIQHYFIVCIVYFQFFDNIIYLIVYKKLFEKFIT